jgi:hypothetical protein
MSAYEARIKTKFGELTIHFADKADLESKLKQVSELSSTIETTLGSILVKETEKVLSEFADLCTTSPDGSFKLLKYPKKKAQILRLAAFLSPTPLNAAQLKQITGVDNPRAYTGKDFMPNPDGTFSLSSNGRTKVANKIIPALRAGKV